MHDPKLPVYEVLNNSFNAPGYSCTNEEPERFRELLKGKTFKRVLSICSGGEIPLMILLPRTTKEVIAVDHSERALLATYLKVVILNHYGPKEAIKILTGLRSESEVAKVCKVVDQVPNHLREVKSYNAYPAGVLVYDAGNLNREWKLAREQDLRATIKKLHLLKLVQGDLMDVLKKYDPFELLYFSNAFEHTGRSGKYPDPRSVERLLGPGGLVLTAAATSSSLEEHSWCKSKIAGAVNPLGWEKLASIPGKRASWSAYGLYQTSYSLHRIPEACHVCGGMCECNSRKARVNRMAQP